MTPFEAILYEDSRKKAIIEHAQVLYGTTYPKDHVWTVTIGLKAFWYTAYINVSEEPGTAQAWKTLLSGKRDESVVKALDNLLEGLYAEVARSKS